MSPWLEKQLHLIDFTLASLARRKTKNVGLLLAYTLIVFVLASLSLFFNDVDLCRRLWAGGRRIRYVATAEVLHHRGASTVL